MSKNTFKQLLKSLFSAQLAGLIDFLTAMMLANCGLYYVASTFCGALTGGIANCGINYKWVFTTKDCSKRNIAIKYLLVWCGSIFLNTYGTYLLTESVLQTEWAARLSGLFAINLFLIPKIIVAIFVSIFWNFLLHKNFVYRNCHIDEKLRLPRIHK